MGPLITTVLRNVIQRIRERRAGVLERLVSSKIINQDCLTGILGDSDEVVDAPSEDKSLRDFDTVSLPSHVSKYQS